MPRYFFDLLNGHGLTRDEEGREFADESAARDEAIRQARPIMAEEVLTGRLDLSGCIIVRGDGERRLFELPFPEAVVIEKLLMKLVKRFRVSEAEAELLRSAQGGVT